VLARLVEAARQGT